MSARKKQSAKQKRPAKKPTAPPAGDVRLFSEQEREEFLSRNDYTGFEYLKALRVREKKNRTPAQEEFLARHDTVEASIRGEPDAVLRQAYQRIDEGVELLLKLIHSRKMRHDETGLSWDRAVGCFASRLRRMNEQLVRLAEIQSPGACSSLWFEAKQLAAAVVRLAVAYPEEFRASAESSLTMPSLRARRADFSCDAPAIAKAVHLGEKHHAPDIHDNRCRLGALCHYLGANIVDEVESVRRQKEDFERTAIYAKGFSRFCDGDVIDLPLLATKLMQPTKAVSIYLKKRLCGKTRQLLASYQAPTSNPAPLRTALVDDFNRIVSAHSIYDAHRFGGVTLRPETGRLLTQNPQGESLRRLNRLLLEDACACALSRGLTKTDRIIPGFYHPSVCSHYEACWTLPELPGHAPEWWDGRVKEMVQEEFVRMKKNATHNPGLWQELVRATNDGTEKEKWRVLEKNCRNKLKRIAGENTPQA